MIKVNLDQRGNFQVKVNLGVLRCYLCKEVVLKIASLHVLLVIRGTMGNAYRVPVLSLFVVKMYTR